MPTLISMWNVNGRFDAPLILEKLALVGFQVGSTGGVVRVEKYGCASEFRRTQDNHYQMTILPSILVNGNFTRLWDAGYQKFCCSMMDAGFRRWRHSLDVCEYLMRNYGRR